MSQLERLKQELIDATGAAQWEDWLPKLEAVIEESARQAKVGVAEECDRLAADYERCAEQSDQNRAMQERWESRRETAERIAKICRDQ